MKFGGSSVGTTTALTQVVSIILQEQERWERLILVVSALEGVTDALIEAARLAQLSNRRGYRRIAATIRARHLALIEQLPLGSAERSTLHADIDQLLFDMLDICQNIADTTTEDSVAPDKIDSIIGVGERLSTRIIAALLRQNNLRSVAVDATELIISDHTYGNAHPNMPLTQQRIDDYLLPMVERRIVPVITGFIAQTTSGKTTTLGRGGSDLTASVLAVCAGAKEVWIWTDVDGMMSTDPREIPKARVIPELSYDEVAELAYFGARILHSRMIIPLRDNNIPLRIKNVYRPQQRGTLIHIPATRTQRTLKAVTSIHGIGLNAHQSGPLSTIASIVDSTLYKTIGNHADVMISAQSSTRSFVAFVIPTSAGPDAAHATYTALEERLEAHPDTLSWTVNPVRIITVIGAELDTVPELTARVFSTLGSVRILAIAQGPSQCSLSIVIQPQDGDIVLERIHDLILNNG